jgi:putative DNA primase/helicase
VSTNDALWARLTEVQQAAALAAVATGSPSANGSGPDPTAANSAAVDLSSYRPEDGGILDAWLNRYGADRRFVAGWLEWRRWAGTHWALMTIPEIHAEIIALIDEMNQFWRAKLARTSRENTEAAKIATAHIAATKRTAGRVASVEAMARALRFIDLDAFDSAGLLNLANGTLDLATWELRPHARGDLLSYVLPYPYDPSAVAENWLWALSRHDQGAVNLLQEFGGYTLTPDTRHEIALWLYGPRGRGASTIISGFQTMLGPRAGLLGLADVERNRFALAQIPGKTLVVSAEQPSDFLSSTHVLNALISGEPIQIERKFVDQIAITPRCKILWAMNEYPRVGDAGNGIFRRVKVLQFDAIPENEQRPELKEAIAQEGAGILNWAIEGLKRLQRRGRFEIPPGVQAATGEFARLNDIPANFVDECCLVGPEYRVNAAQLYNSYSQWAKDTGHKPQSLTTIAADWQRLGFEKYRANGRSFYRGVGLKEEAGE